VPGVGRQTSHAQLGGTIMSIQELINELTIVGSEDGFTTQVVAVDLGDGDVRLDTYLGTAIAHVRLLNATARH
jgi:hypothetical protein